MSASKTELWVVLAMLLLVIGFFVLASIVYSECRDLGGAPLLCFWHSFV